MGITAPVAAETASKGAETAGAGAGAAKGAETAAGAAGAPLDLLSFGSAAGTAIPEAVGATVPATGALASGLATEPLFASSAAGAFAPGLDTGAAGLSFGAAGGSGPLSFGGAPAGTTTGVTAGSPLDAGPTIGPSTPAAPAPAGPAAASFAPPSGISPALGTDPTAAISGAGASPLDTAAYPAGPVGAPGGGVPGIGAAADGSVSGGSAAASNSGGLSFDRLLQGAETSIGRNPVGLALATGGLGYNILQGQRQSGAVRALQDQATAQGATGAELASYLRSGTLPPGLQTSVDQASAGARARIIASYAAQGLGSDPTHNSALAQDLAAVDERTSAMIAQIGQQLLTSGASYSQMSDQLLGQLAQIDQTQTSNIGRSIASMAAALNTGSTRIQIGGTGNG